MSTRKAAKREVSPFNIPQGSARVVVRALREREREERGRVRERERIKPRRKEKRRGCGKGCVEQVCS